VDQIFPAILVLALGLVVLLAGARRVLLGAGLGALLGIGILSLLPGDQSGWEWWIIPALLAVLFAIGAGILGGFVGIIALAMGALAGAVITGAVLDLLNVDLGTWTWILVLIGAAAGAFIAPRFERWTLIVLAALIGASLTIKGVQMLFPSLPEVVAWLFGALLVVGGIVFQGKLRRGRRGPSARA
jgi:hypothetical protein